MRIIELKRKGWFSIALVLGFCVISSDAIAQTRSNAKSKTQLAKNRIKTEKKTASIANDAQENVVENENVAAKKSEPSANPTKLDSDDALITTSRNNSALPVPPKPNLTRVGVQSGISLALSLNDAIRKALENNNQIEVSRDDVKIAEKTLQSLQGIYDPTFLVSPTYSRNSRTGSGATNDYRISSNFEKVLEKGGGNYSVFFNTNKSGGLSQAGFTTPSSSSSALGISYTQPLFRNRSIDNTRRQIKIQQKRIQQSDVDFRRQAISIISQVQRAYWDLVFALRDEQNRKANLDLTRENLRRVEAQIAAGSAAPLQRAEVSTELANRESDLLSAQQSVSIAENSLKQLFLKDPISNEWQMQIVPTEAPVVDTTSIDVQSVLKDAIENRPELSRLKLQKEINDIDLEYYRNQIKPRIDFNSTFSLNGYSQTGQSTITSQQYTGNDLLLLSFINQERAIINNPLLPQIGNPTVTVVNNSKALGGFTKSIQNIFDKDSPNFSVGVTIQIPLHNKTAKADLARVEIERNQLEANTRLQEQTVIVEVRNAVQAVETARQRVFAARRARENAEIQLKGEQKLFEVGRSTTFLLFQRENALTNARNSEIRAETDYSKSLSDLQRATSTTLQLNNVEVKSQVPSK